MTDIKEKEKMKEIFEKFINELSICRPDIDTNMVDFEIIKKKTGELKTQILQKEQELNDRIQELSKRGVECCNDSLELADEIEVLQEENQQLKKNLLEKASPKLRLNIDCKTCKSFQKNALKIKEFTDAKEQEIKDKKDKEWTEKINNRLIDHDKALEKLYKEKIILEEKAYYYGNKQSLEKLNAINLAIFGVESSKKELKFLLG